MDLVDRFQLPQIIEKNFGYIDGLTAVPKSMM